MNLESYCELLGKEDFLAKEDICLVLKRVAKSLSEVERRLGDVEKDGLGWATNILDLERRLALLEEKVGAKRPILPSYPAPVPVKRATKEQYWAIKKPTPLLDKWDLINGEIQHFVRSSPEKGWVIDLECTCQYCTKTH